MTNAFVIGEGVYCLTAIAVINSFRTQFPSGSVQSRIDGLLLIRLITAGIVVVKVAQNYGLEIGVGDAYIEWIAFNMSFVAFGLFSVIMPYTLKVVPE